LELKPGLQNIMQPLEEARANEVARQHLREREAYIKDLEDQI
jgi:hypothetical protein